VGTQVAIWFSEGQVFDIVDARFSQIKFGAGGWLRHHPDRLRVAGIKELARDLSNGLLSIRLLLRFCDDTRKKANMEDLSELIAFPLEIARHAHIDDNPEGF
jgi:hypothetical protein